MRDSLNPQFSSISPTALRGGAEKISLANFIPIGGGKRDGSVGHGLLQKTTEQAQTISPKKMVVDGISHS